MNISDFPGCVFPISAVLHDHPPGSWFRFRFRHGFLVHRETVLPLKRVRAGAPDVIRADQRGRQALESLCTGEPEHVDEMDIGETTVAGKDAGRAKLGPDDQPGR